MTNKKKPKPMPKVWGQKPKFKVLGQYSWYGKVTLYNENSGRACCPLLELISGLHPTRAAALRAIRKLWRETFGGGE